MPKKVAVISGGAGFIGSHLCEKLYSTGYEVISIDNYFTGTKNNHLNGVHYIDSDVCNINKLDIKKPDIFFHLGEYSRVEQSFEDFDLVWQFNKQGIYEILKFCHQNDCKLVYAGSSTKYSDIGFESSPYSWTKATNTSLVASYAKWFGLNYAITYFYNAYGPREISDNKYATIIAIFSEQMRLGKKLTVVKPGSQKRNFTHVLDIVEGLFVVGESGQGDNYGIGSREQFSLVELANLFGGIIEFLPERKGNRMTAELNIERTLALGWAPKHSLRDYVNKLKQNDWKII